MNNSLLLKISESLDSDRLSLSELAAEINDIISQHELSEQLELHGSINKKQLARLYSVLNLVHMDSSVKEHITWNYFKNKCDETDTTYINEELLEEIVETYRESKYLGLESLIIDALKTDKIQLNQISKLEKCFFSKAFIKESVAFKHREIIRDGGILDKEQVVTLLKYRAYTTVELAIDQSAVSKDGLIEVRKPNPHENDRKLREKLFHKAQNLYSHSDNRGD
ncbi:hypothetical protein [Paenibacillus woosongensis]|uniref:Uncharacterized protein n=1 Tax=Paenibacillus woosongensis TaxID=307580 RepID=A0A7X2Z469_9BACL|nr:hypothetical protein [Paenibacillus woosongensis]MUG46444.1 hypothetical protein [Paenibacillus woosongensis]